jgi:hypothetical protein
MCKKDNNGKQKSMHVHWFYAKLFILCLKNVIE